MADLNARLEAAARNYEQGELASSGVSLSHTRITGNPAPAGTRTEPGRDGGMQRRMAVDFLKHYKSELHPEVAEFFQQQLDSEGTLDAQPSPPSRTPSPGDPVRRARIDNAQAVKTCAHELAERGEHAAAASEFEKAIQVLVGADFQVPLSAEGGGYMSQKYLELDEVERSMLMSSCAALACALQKKSAESGCDVARALSYYEEVEIIHRHHTMSVNVHDPQHQWLYASLPFTEYWQARMVSMVNAYYLHMSLGNTSMAYFRLHTIQSQYLNNFVFEKDMLKKILPPTSIYFETAGLRHPEPRWAPEARVTCPDMQVLGSWEKLHVSGKGLPARQGDSSFVWNSRLYVLGGFKVPKTGPFYGDFHWLDLNRLDGWHPLPPFPVKPEAARQGPVCAYHAMYVHQDTLYCFTGLDTMCAFDLVKEKWYHVQLTPGVEGSQWPIKIGLRWFASTYASKRQQFYVFGGKHSDERLGCDLFLVIDTQTGQWRQLSGHARAADMRADYQAPGPRVNAMMWADADDKKIYLFGGEADRSGAHMHNQEHGASISYPYDDFWSWDVEGEFWTRERVSGNPPCPRSEAGYVFNPSLNSAFIFGGYNPAMTSSVIGEDGRERVWEFQYFADTFMLDMGARASPDEPMRWKQILTRGFPTYRANCRLLTDTATGKTFLYGGYTSHEYIPFYKQARCFSDIWQLKLDVPGGFFDDVDIEDEARSAKAGPWQRCFACGSTGRNWKKCGGSCDGRVLFCGKECQLEGWKEHKRMHDCRKK